MEVFCYSLSADDNTSFRRKITEESEHFVDLSKVVDGGVVLVGVVTGVVARFLTMSKLLTVSIRTIFTSL